MVPIVHCVEDSNGDLDRHLNLQHNGQWEPCFYKSTIWFWIRLQNLKEGLIISKLVLLRDRPPKLTQETNTFHQVTNNTQLNLSLKIAPTLLTVFQMFTQMIQTNQFLLYQNQLQ